MRSLIGGILDRAPVPYASTRQNAFTSAPAGGGDRTAQLNAYGSVGTLYAIVSSLAYDTAAVDWHLYRTPTPGTAPEHREEVTRHLALDVWNKPNPFFHRQSFVETFQQHLDLPGEAYWIVVKTASIPLELWPVRPDRMEPVPSATDYLKGWVYTGPDGGEKVPLDLDEVIQIRLPNPTNPYRGLGPVGSILADLDSAKFGAEYNRNFFINSASPGGIIKVEKRLSDDEFDEMRDRWREQHQGVAQAHRVAIIEQGEWVDRSYSMKDMAFAELRNLSSEKIREAYRYPKPMLGTVEDVNRANAAAARVIYAEGCLVSRLERIKLALNGFYLPMFGSTGKGVEFDYDSPVPEDEELEQKDRTSKAQAFKTYIDARVSPKSAAAIVGLPEDLEMDPVTAVSPQNGGPSPVTPDTAAARHPGPDPAMTAVLASNRALTSALRVVAAREPHTCAHRHPAADEPGEVSAVATPPEPPDGIPATLPDQAGPDLTPVQDSWEAALTALLATWAGLTAIQKASLVEQVRQLVAAGDIIGLTSLHVASTDGAAQLEDAMVALAADAAAQVVAEAAEQEVTVPAGVVPRHGLAATAQVAAATLAAGLAMSATRAALRSWGAGSTPQQVADTVAGQLAELTTAQDEYVLGGSLTQAQHEGRLATIQAGPSSALYADEVLDRATCPNCRAVNRKWIGNSDDPLQPWLLTYPIRGYVDCLGRDRCRGQVIAVWRGGSDWTKWIEQPPQRGDG